MGTRQARLQRQIEAAQGRYVTTLLLLGTPPATDPRAHSRYQWYDPAYREKVRETYLAMHRGTPRPSEKTIKKFLRGYMTWLRREVAARAGV